MTFISAVLITLACVGISYFVWNYCRQIFFVRKKIILPGPRNLPSCMKNFLRGTPDELLDIFIMLTRNYPSPFQISMHSIPIVIIYEPNQVKAILQSQYCLEKSIFYKFMKPIFGTGLLTAPASIWKQNRKIITSRDSPTALREFFDILVEQSLIFANELENIILNGNEIIFLDHMTKCAESVASGATTKMGIKMESDKTDQVFKAVARLKEILKYRMYFVWLNDFLFYNVIFNLTALGREQRKILKLMESFITEKIQQQLPELNKLQTTNKKFFNIFMKIFCKKDFTQETIRNDVITIIMANDKISVTINFVVFMLANFPEIQEKVYKELSEIYGTETPMSAPVKYDDLQHMHYLDRVIKETMRLFPAIPIIGRQLTEDMKIGKTILPKDTDVIILLIRMYRNEEYWPNPLKFDPDRFLPERIKDCHSCYHIPFSDGPRNCIGIKYAIISMKVILATLIRKFVFKTDKSIGIDKIKLKTDVTLSTVEPLKVRLEKRDL